MIGIPTIRRTVALAALAGGVALAGACGVGDKLLKVENPEQLPENALNDPKLITTLVNSVVGDFQNMYSDPVIWRGSMLTDEQVTGINWEQTARINQRIIKYNEGDPDLMFRDISKARAMADSTAGRFRTLLDNPDTDARMAKVLAYAGYDYILLAEIMCQSTVNEGQIQQPADMFKVAVDRLTEALTIAQAAGASDIANLARVGLARANLGLGNNDQVKQYASQVPADFHYWVQYAADPPDLNNVLWSREQGQNHSLGVAPHFLDGGSFGEQDLTNQMDPRVQHTVNWTHGHNGLTKLYKPYQSLLFSGYNGQAIGEGGSPATYTADMDIALASGIEAAHDYAEADGPTAATLAFVNARRAVGNMPPVNVSGHDLMLELHEQRGRDLYLAGFRLGDLRRWKAQGDDLFPSGTHPNAEWGLYGDATCFPLPSTEYESNPNINKPGS